MSIWTVGHSTHPFDAFLEILQAHQIGKLADVRTIPKSRRHPHFAGPALERALAAAGIEYRHFGDLGGLRKPRADSSNTAWRNESFRGYADYMETPAFRGAIDELLRWARDGNRRVVVMCAEAVWWRCHRQLIADALVARGVEVEHIVSTSPADRHRLAQFARVTDGRVSYPGLLD